MKNLPGRGLDILPGRTYYKENEKWGGYLLRREYNLGDLLDIPHWEKVQDQLAKSTGTAIITIDFKGNPITKHSCRTEFCSVIRENPTFRKRCCRCDALAGLEAVRLERPYVYLCHCGIVDVAVPVMVGQRYLGSVMFGQVRLAPSDPAVSVERLVNQTSSFQAQSDNVRQDLLEKYNKLPQMEYERILEIAQLIGAMIDYIVERSVARRNETQIQDWMVRTRQETLGESQPTFQPHRGYPAVAKSSPIYPAVAYVATHPEEMVTMKEMAQLCHLSPSYFSRLFTREVGEGFTNYANRQKVELAKQQLRETGKTISQISADLGYLNTSHFINLFKRFEGITPSLYRQQKYY